MSIFNAVIAYFAEIERKKNLFRLNDLPYIARVHAIQQMEHREQIKLALSSKKMEQNVKQAGLKSEVCTIDFAEGLSEIVIDEDDTILDCHTSELCTEGSEYINQEQLMPWFGNATTYLRRTAEVYDRLQKVISPKCLELIIDVESTNNIKSILAVPEFQNFERLNLEGGEITKKQLDSVMTTANNNREIEISGTKIPEDYSHRNAFKFFIIAYEDALWVRCKHLASLKDSYSVTLEKNKLRFSADIKRFVKFWINSEHDMFRFMTINQNAWMTITEEKFTRKLNVLKLGPMKFVLKCKTPTNRKLPLLFFSVEQQQIQMSTSPIEEYFDAHNGQKVKSQMGYYNTLVLIEEKKNIEDSLKRLEEGETLMTTDEERDDSARKKAEINATLKEVEEKLEKCGIDFEDGIAVSRPL